jgi:serine/threonine protein kinase
MKFGESKRCETLIHEGVDTMSASRRELPCDEISLDVLLFGDEASGEFQESSGHVESCARCQDRLAQLAGDPDDWAEVRSALRPDATDVLSCQPDSSAGQGTDERDVVSHSGVRAASQAARKLRLDFLAAPSHPEMLGRLGRYEIEKAIGAGGFGIVLKGFDTELNRPVAIKVLAPHLAHSGPARQRFAREARAAAAVVHEHVVAIHNVESEHEVPFLVMQYVHGQSLQERVERDGPLTTAQILRIGMQAAAGLSAAHAQGVIHRDVKPANILLENGIERALLTDFGLARAADDASLTHSGIVAGTPHYMSPEQADGRPTDARSDLFSLGSVLYFMATGHPPFRAERPVAVLHRICHEQHRPVWEINSAIPDELVDVIDRLLEKKPSGRFASASDVQDALARVLSNVQHPSRWPARRLLRRVRRRRRQILAAVTIPLIALAIGVAQWKGGWFRPNVAKLGKTEERGSSAALQVALELLASEGAQQVEFANQVVLARRSLNEFERNPYPEAIVALSQRDPWIMDLHAAESELSRLERKWLSNRNSQMSASEKGENP